MANIKELVTHNPPETAEYFHPIIQYAQINGMILMTFDDGHVYTSNDGVVWTSTEAEEYPNMEMLNV